MACIIQMDIKDNIFYKNKMNHNIINKILYLKAYEEWLERIKLINKEYGLNYVYVSNLEVKQCDGMLYYNKSLLYYPYKYHKKDILTSQDIDINETYNGYKRFVLTVAHRFMSHRYGISYIKWCNSVDTNITNYGYSLPENYIYSSGLDDLNGYKG